MDDFSFDSSSEQNAWSGSSGQNGWNNNGTQGQNGFNGTSAPVNKPAYSNPLLLTASILLLIGAVAAVLVSAVSVFGAPVQYPIMLVAFALDVVNSGVKIIGCVKGIKGSSDPQVGASCFTWGIAIIVMALAVVAFTTVATGTFSPVSLLPALLMPILYLVGADKAKKAL